MSFHCQALVSVRAEGKADSEVGNGSCCTQRDPSCLSHAETSAVWDRKQTEERSGIRGMGGPAGQELVMQWRQCHRGSHSWHSGD